MPRAARTQPKKGYPVKHIVTPTGLDKFEVRMNVAPKGTNTRKMIVRRFDLVTEAETFVDKTRAAKIDGTQTVPSKVTLEQLADQWATHYTRGIRSKTMRGYKDALKPALTYSNLSKRRVQTITVADIDAVLDHMAKHGGRGGNGYSKRSITLTRTVLRLVFEYGVKTDVLRRNVVDVTEAPRLDKDDEHDVVPWEVEDVRRFVATADQIGENGHEKPVVQIVRDADGNAVMDKDTGKAARIETTETVTYESWLAAGMRLTGCGLRRGEVCGLWWEDVDLDTGRVHVAASLTVGEGNTLKRDKTKNKKDRYVEAEVIQPGTKTALKALWLAQGRPTMGPVVRTPDGKPVHPDLYSARFETVVEAAGITMRQGIHSLRHTLATIMHENGVAPANAAAMLGHTVAVHMKHYVKATDKGAAAAAAALGGVFSAAAK